MKRYRIRFGSVFLTAAAISAVFVLPWSDSHAQSSPTFSVDWHYISAGVATTRNSCFVLSGTVGQPAPGYSSASNGEFALLAGFWVAAPTTNVDEIFFNGFEEC